MVFLYLFVSIVVFLPIFYMVFITWFTWEQHGEIEGVLKLFMGKAGSGKSTYMASVVCKSQKKCRPVYSNTHVLGALKIQHGDLGKYDINDCDILIDEAQMVYDSRDFKNFSEFNKYFFSHYRHHGVRIFIFSQSFEDLDVKIRRQARFLYIFQPFVKGLIMMQKVKMKFGVSEDNREIVTLYKTSIFGFRFHMGFLYWKYFDSYSRPNLPKLPYNEKWGEIPQNISLFRKKIKLFKNKED
jgi:hypothetical protein